MNKEPKLLKILCVVSFVLMTITLIPLFIKYLFGSSPASQLMVHLHVWLGIAFIILASMHMFVFKGLKNRGNQK